MKRLCKQAIAITTLCLAAWNLSHAADPFSARSPAVRFHYTNPLGRETVQWAYGEATAEPGPAKTYNCVLGFTGGYFGFQRNGEGGAAKDRRFIFSLWDKGFVTKGEKAADNASKADQVTTLVAKGSGVDTHDFDHEGSGGHSHWEHAWKDKQTYGFLLGVKSDKDAAIFTAYVLLPEKKEWKLIASFRRPNTEAKLTGIYSFVEDFGGKEPKAVRVCHFGNLWAKGHTGSWKPITDGKATVSAKPGRADFDHLVEEDQFVLSTGGGAEATHSEGKTYSVKASKDAPKIDFAKLPTK